ncbi:MAG: GNAT family N-acetyltransferase [Anaerolineales bacterium]
MTAGILSRSKRREAAQGLRRVNPRLDMAAVARLIETSFAGDLDRLGRQMVREMQSFGRAGWLGWLIGHLFLPPAAFPQGFVWQEGDRLVGNASLLPVGSGSSRWVLANVAVDPAFRRRGIAMRMVQACLEMAGDHHVDEIVLQVGSDNKGAKALYRKLGFTEWTTRTEWVQRSERRVRRDPGVAIRKRQQDEWRAEWALAQELFPEGLYWPYPLDSAWFSPEGWRAFLSPAASRHWVVAEREGAITAGISARFSQDSRGWRLALLVPPDERPELEVALVRRALHDLHPSGLGVSLSYPPGEVDSAWSGLGFRPRRTLSWMGITLSDDLGRRGSRESRER